MNIREILRAGHVTRWHIVRTHRQQTIAEHMYLTTMIAADMAQKIGFSSAMIQDLTMWVLWHDLPEVLTGDIPTPAKRMIKKYLNFGAVEDATSPDYAERRARVEGTAVETLSKIADVMEGILFLDDEGVNVDNTETHASRVRAGLIKTYRDLVAHAQLKYPGYEWFFLLDYREEIKESPVEQLTVQPTVA